MGKGMKAGKRPKQPKMGNAQQMAQMQAMQREMDKVQEEIEQMETTATAGGGAVTVTVTGKKEVKDIQIQPEVCGSATLMMWKCCRIWSWPRSTKRCARWARSSRMR